MRRYITFPVSTSGSCRKVQMTSDPIGNPFRRSRWTGNGWRHSTGSGLKTVFNSLLLHENCSTLRVSFISTRIDFSTSTGQSEKSLSRVIAKIISFTYLANLTSYRVSDVIFDIFAHIFVVYRRILTRIGAFRPERRTGSRRWRKDVTSRPRTTEKCSSGCKEWCGS